MEQESGAKWRREQRMSKKLTASENIELHIMAVMVAMQAGELSEGQAAKLLVMDRISVRDLRRQLLQIARDSWAKHREIYPLSEWKPSEATDAGAKGEGAT